MSLKTQQKQVDELKERVEKHRWHISKMESILRMLDNDQLDIDPVNEEFIYCYLFMNDVRSYQPTG